ncbi:hypothetical protein NM208_g15983 [Fusarium decemcellulare]|uniref:Uncharacterized protein n=1 Tax=Fusarium decemcellulare TaxID=57161 RepID=A0ACC1RE45_9HYPO|nr:hypothetical protein NM208_g15983 [Fusarium decemcellulare]
MPDNIIPIINHASAITLGPTRLCHILFFNPLFYLTISNGSDQAAVEPLTTPLRSLDESWNLTVTLIDDFISTRFSHEELKRYLASDHGPDASKRLASSALWIYNGLRKKDIMDTRSRGVMLHGRAKQLWSDIDFDVFIGWLQSIDLSFPFVKARLTQPYSPGQDLFIAPERDWVNYTTTSSPIPIQKLPKELPDSSCTILQTCHDPQPHSAPDIQVIHPSCQIWHDHSSPEIMLKRLEQWAISARQRNLTWASTVMEADRLFSPNRVAEYFWPNQTAFPPILDQVMILAQFNDVISQTIQSADAIMMDDRWRRAGLLSRAENWVKGVPADRTMENPEEAIHQLKIAQRHVTRQLRDVIQGLGEVYSICQKFADFSALLDGLYSPANWIV